MTQRSVRLRSRWPAAVPAAPVLFVHGAGKAGRAAWPAQHGLERERACVWLPRVAAGDPPDRMVALASSLLDRPAHVVAHSYGGLTALRLAEQHPDLVRSLTLVEPAALALSLNALHTRTHVDAMRPVFARAADDATDDREFSRLFAEAVGRPAPDVTDEVLTALVGQLRATLPPWSVPVDATVVARTPTLVFLGSLDTMYGEVSEALVVRGADRAVLEGTGHRPHDDERFAGVLDGFWRVVDG